MTRAIADQARTIRIPVHMIETINRTRRGTIASPTTCPEATAASTWKIDPAHTDILLSAKHMMVTTVRGKFDLVEGELELDEAEPTNSKGEIPGVCRQPLDRSGEARRPSPFGRSL